MGYTTSAGKRSLSFQRRARVHADIRPTHALGKVGGQIQLLKVDLHTHGSDLWPAVWLNGTCHVAGAAHVSKTAHVWADAVERNDLCTGTTVYRRDSHILLPMALNSACQAS